MDEKWYQDAILNPEFCVDYQQKKNILLTGATGFVGSHILYELLKQTNGEIFVIVRGGSEEEGFERVKKKLMELQIWEESSADRIHAICGNLEQLQLGISDSLWKLLSNTIDLIIHDAAYVNLIGTYEKHYEPNVVSTLQLLELARIGKYKRFVYVSTSGIFGGLYQPQDFEEGYTIMEDAKIPTVRSIFAYVRTKWVADQLVQQAAKQGIDTAIFRLPHVGSDKITGCFNQGDIFWSRLKAFSKLGKAPVIEHLFYVIPVDYLAKTLVHISNKKFTGLNFYTTVSNEKITWMSVADAIRNGGYQIDIMEMEDWYAYVKKYLAENQDRDVHAMFAYATDNFSLFRCPYMSNKYYMEALPEPMRHCQDINEIVASYFKYGNAQKL